MQTWLSLICSSTTDGLPIQRKFQCYYSSDCSSGANPGATLLREAWLYAISFTSATNKTTGDHDDVVVDCAADDDDDDDSAATGAAAAAAAAASVRISSLMMMVMVVIVDDNHARKMS